VEQDFIETNQTYYSADVDLLDFSDESSVNTINNWVSEKTHEKITEIISFIPPDAVMYLINAIYFKGIWKYEFDEEDTETANFYLSDKGTVEVEMMKQQENFNYFSNDLMQAIELPYNDSSYSMIILLPEDNIDNVINSLDIESWDQLISGFSVKDIVIRLPKFQFEYKNILNDELTDMGMGIAFSGSADFSKINPTFPLFISRIIHKTFVEVNEEGTEAAAVTAVEISFTCANCGSEKIYFTVNKPFLFVIKENTSNSIVFIGKVMDPTIK
jgi:serpin B